MSATFPLDPQTAVPPAPIPPAGPVHMGDWESATKALRSAPWILGQAWRKAPQDDFRPGAVHLGWHPDALWVLANLTDDHIASRSTRHNQDMWTLGDVFEVFLARRGSPHYLELHVTPNNHRLHLRWTAEGFAAAASGRKEVAEFHADAQAFDSRVERAGDGTCWRILTRIPAEIVPGGAPWRPGEQLDLSFSRYDAGSGTEADILSSTSPHAEPNYHRRAEWRTAVLAAPGTA